MYRLGGASHASPLEIGLRDIGIGLKCMFIAQFFMALISFSHKKVMGYFKFFFYTLQTFYSPVPYPMRKKKKF